MPVITSIPFWAVVLAKGEACWLVFHTCKTFACQGSSIQGIWPWRAGRSRTLSFSFGFSLLFWIVFHSALISSRALTFCCPLYAISTASFSFARGLPFWLQQRQRRAFQVVFHEKRNASHDFSVPGIGTPFLKSGVVSRFTLLNHIFNVRCSDCCDGKKKSSPEFPRRVACSSRVRYHSIAY